MDLLLLLKKKEEVLGYRGKGDFSFEDKNKKISQGLSDAMKIIVLCLLAFKL